MKLENYEFIESFVVPAYWYEEGKGKEQYFIDSQTLIYNKLWKDLIKLKVIDEEGKPIKDEKENNKMDPRKWWFLSPVKPKGVEITSENKNLIKWVVNLSYHDDEPNRGSYEFCEWDFDKHCIKNMEELKEEEKHLTLREMLLKDYPEKKGFWSQYKKEI